VLDSGKPSAIRFLVEPEHITMSGLSPTLVVGLTKKRLAVPTAALRTEYLCDALHALHGYMHVVDAESTVYRSGGSLRNGVLSLRRLPRPIGTMR
jgi:hypothetical protein